VLIGWEALSGFPFSIDGKSEIDRLCPDFVTLHFFCGCFFHLWLNLGMEPKYFINLKDILRLHFECSQCHSQISFQSWGEGRNFPFTCPQCGAGWFGRTDEGNEKHARELVYSILRIARAKELFETRNVAISIEVEGPRRP
jgi:hypothetical protein